jgi:hypothetical protein
MAPESLSTSAEKSSREANVSERFMAE